MISIVIDTNIIFSSLYNKEGNERVIINLILENDDIQLFAPDIFNVEISRNLETKLNFDKELINRMISDFDIIEVPYENYKIKINQARKLIFHQNDIPYIAVALLINSPIWSGNEKHFKHLENSKEIIWFNSRNVSKYLKEKGFLKEKLQGIWRK